MAHYLSNYQPSGTLYGATFVKGTASRAPHIRQSSSLNKAKWRSDQKFKYSRQAAVEFGGASKLSSHIYSSLGTICDLCQPYTHNHIADLIRSTTFNIREQKVKRIEQRQGTKSHKESQIKDSQIKNSPIPDSQIEDSQIPDSRFKDSQIKDSQIPNSRFKFRRLKSFPAPIAAATLHGLQLGTAGRTPKPHPRQQHDRPAPIGASLQPIAITGTDGRYTLHGLQRTHAAMPALKPNQCREFRIHIAIVALSNFDLDPNLIDDNLHRATYRFQDSGPDGFRSTHLNPSGWINPAHLSNPDGSDSLALGQINFPQYSGTSPDDRLIVVVAIEWRQRTGHRVTKLKSCATVTVVEIFGITHGQAQSLSIRKHPYTLRPRYQRKVRGIHPVTGIGRPVRLPTRAQRISQALQKLPLRR